ncbi:Glutamate receptor 1-like 5, partial [Homarus americanus]
VWVVLAVVLGLSGIVGSILSWLATPQLFSPIKTSNATISPPGHKSRNDPSTEVFQHSWPVRAVLREPVCHLPRTASGRVFLGTWLISALILTSAYQGILTSLLAVPFVTVPVDSLEDLVNYGKIPWANEKGTSMHHFFSSSKSGLNKKVYEGSSFVYSCNEVQHTIRRGDLAVICDFFSMRKIMSEDFGETGECNYHIATEPIRAAPLAFAFPKGSTLVPHFNKWMAPLKESGLVSRSVMEVTANATACLVPPGKEEGYKPSLILTLTDFAGIFLLFAACLVFSFLVFITEKIHSCCSYRA